jgi:UDP-N-acetylglucosamine 4,6-dehydratase
MRTVIVGGTGTLGKELVRQILERSPEADILVVSRDELKQQEMKRRFPTLAYQIGDVRDSRSLERAFRGADTVYHVAALKHVDVVEANPEEAIRTNIDGTINFAEAAIAAGVRLAIFSSTDKAVLPINTYGATKMISERYLLGLNGRYATTFLVYRWGNVLGSRGSAVHSFAQTLASEGKAYLTHPEMTRFWIHIRDAVKFMLDTRDIASISRVSIPPMKAAKVTRLIEAVAEKLGVDSFGYEITGIRLGEKIHEQLESNHDFCIRSDTAPQLTDEELRAMVREVV